MQLYLSVTPQQIRPAAAYCRNFAHVAYRISTESTLLQSNLLIQTRGGILSLSDLEAPPITAPDRLASAVVRECYRRGYAGVLADFECAPTQDRRQFLSLLVEMLRKNQRALYVPQNYRTLGAITLLTTAISGGNFQTYLEENARQGPVALDLQRLRMDFPLPAPSGEGVPLSADAFSAMAQGQSIFYSPALCARYFTCSRGGEHHFVLFDDADTLRQKIQSGNKLGIRTAFLMYPETADLLPALFGSSRPRQSFS